MLQISLSTFLLATSLSICTGTNCEKQEQCPENTKCIIGRCVPAPNCPPAEKFGPGPDLECEPVSDPNKMPKAPLEEWFTREAFDDLFPKSNLGWGPHKCAPYTYDAFVIAARYFPRFANETLPESDYSADEIIKRDLATFFAHAVQETGENDASLYAHPEVPTVEDAHSCFYRGGFFNWFEGGPKSSFLDQESPGYKPKDGFKCNKGGRYCAESAELNYWFPCNQKELPDEEFTGCYFGRGAIQISYNYNYGQFQQWLHSVGIFVDLLEDPNIVMTKRDPPLAVLASLWFYMTPQPPKPAMHDIIIGQWEPGPENREAGYKGPIFGPTSLIINNECNGEDEGEPGGPGESRRIKAFKWFCKYFDVPTGEQWSMSCKGMPKRLEDIRHPLSYQPDWQTSWKPEYCKCAPASYGGMIPYFEPGYYPQRFVDQNAKNFQKCVFSMYDNPVMYGLDRQTTACLNATLPMSFSRRGIFQIIGDEESNN